MKESTIHKNIIKWLREHGFWAIKIPGSAFLRGFPDVLAVKDGRAYFFEVKLPGGKATALQLKIIEQLRQHGAVAGVVESVDEVALLLFS